MEIRLHKEDFAHTFVDRDGGLNDYGRQGFDIILGDMSVHFEDEDDAVLIAQRVLHRMGFYIYTEPKRAGE